MSGPSAQEPRVKATSLSSEDDRHLVRAIALSREYMEKNAGGPFGAVIVRGEEVLADGWNQVTSTNDPTAHAEVVAIRRACRAIEAFSLEGATLYASCEPCPMCLAAAYWSRVSRIVYANAREDAMAVGFDDSIFYEEIVKPSAARSIPTLHIPSAAAKAVFADWLNKADRIAY